MKKLILPVIALCLALSVFAQKSGRVIVPESYFDYKFNDDNTEVIIIRFKYDRYDDKKKYDGKVIEVPAKIEGRPVTKIAKPDDFAAFAIKGDGTAGLWIPDSVKEIAPYAFDSSNFPSIRLPEGLKTISVGMFSCCKAKSVTIPSSVTRIEHDAFSESQIESISIPKGCTIEGGSTDSMSAFQNCPKLKTVTFPSGRVYFAGKAIDPNNPESNWWRSGEGIFRNCDSLTNVVIPKGFEALYISDNDFANHTLADYFSGRQIKLATLRPVKVRNAAVVEESEYLVEYNKAMNASDWEKAKGCAAEYYNNYSYKSDDWLARFNTAAANFEKKYLDDYKKASDSKDFSKALDVASEYIGKCSYNRSQWEKRQIEAKEEWCFSMYSNSLSGNEYSDAKSFAAIGKKESGFTKYDWGTLYCNAEEKPYLEKYNEAVKTNNRQNVKKVVDNFQNVISKDVNLSSLKDKWDSMLMDFDCTLYLPAYLEKLEKKGSVVRDDSNIQFKIPLSSDVYKNLNFIFKDPEGNALWELYYGSFLKIVEAKTGTKYNMNGSTSSSAYLSRRVTKDESSSYNKARNDAVKLFIDEAEKNAKVEDDGSKQLFKIYLSGTAYNYNSSTFTVKNSSGKVYTMNDKDFLACVKEVCGIEYKLYATSKNPYLFANTKDMLQSKCNFALQSGNLHTNLACKLKDGWTGDVEFEESNGIVSVKSFRAKKSVCKDNGLKKNDVIKKIVASKENGAEIELGCNDLLKVPSPCTVTFTVERGKGKMAKTFVVRVPVEWDMEEMKTVKDIVDLKCILAFHSGNLHTNLAGLVDKQWVCVAEFEESKDAATIKSFKVKKSAMGKSGLKTKDAIKSIVMTNEAGKETKIGAGDLLTIPAPATLTFTVERGSGKKIQLLTINVPVEWNSDEFKNIW